MVETENGIIDAFEVIHEAGLLALVEYARRIDDKEPELLSLSKWTRTVTVENKDAERPFPLLSE